MRLRRRADRSDEADVIWNRATELQLAPDALPGDIALWRVHQLHGVVMNGGLAHGFDVLGREAVESAAAGWDFLGRGDVATLLRDALEVLRDMPTDRDARDRYFTDGWTEEQAERLEALNLEYEDDEGLERAFRKRLRRHPEDFAPTRS
jgi:hypothetical protein